MTQIGSGFHTKEELEERCGSHHKDKEKKTCMDSCPVMIAIQLRHCQQRPFPKNHVDKIEKMEKGNASAFAKPDKA